ncbi:MAG: signal peptidase [Gammaproteobacteria bacterium]|nr:signal peptidase [Gammaproteobacteria bacterium]
MTLDFSAVLVIAVVVTGTILLVDRIRSALNRGTAGSAPAAGVRLLVSYARSFFPIILSVLLFRSFLFEPFRIPSASMMPGLVDGDFIFVDKFSYGLRLPLLNTKIVPIGRPRRGDVIVFRSPSSPSINLIKRLVGLPGDHVVVHDNRVVINGTLIPLTAAGTYSGGYGFSGSGLAVEKFDESEHVVMFASDRWAADFDGVVPIGHYFFMGDNRNDSEDSRFTKVGFVPEGNLVGHARGIWMNWRIPGWPEWHRIGTRIR